MTPNQEIKNCPSCFSPKKIKTFKDWNGLNYDVCGNCGCNYQNPQICWKYEENYWGKIIDPDGNERIMRNEKDFKIRNWYGQTIQFVNSLKPGKILDVGAGLGFFLSAINTKWEKHAHDISVYSIDYIRKQYPKIITNQGDLYALDYPDESFDVIMFYHVIEHLDDPNKALNFLRKLLKSDGTLILGTPNIKSIVARIFKGNFRFFCHSHINLFSPWSLTEVLYKNGFNVFKKEYPFWNTEYATLRNILRIFNPSKISPPFYGNVIIFYARKNYF